MRFHLFVVSFVRALGFVLFVLCAFRFVHRRLLLRLFSWIVFSFSFLFAVATAAAPTAAAQQGGAAGGGERDCAFCCSVLFVVLGGAFVFFCSVVLPAVEMRQC